MTVYYSILTKCKTLLEADIDINTVTRGGIDKVALRKQNMYSLAHITVNTATETSSGNGMIFNMTVFVMDQVDISKDEPTDLFIGNNNEMDVLNTTLASLVRFSKQIRVGQVSEDGFQLQGTPTYEPFAERFKDYVAGWAMTFNIQTSHGMTIC